ncbi:unnamed protein product [Anisakis simplex]|uniref:BED-type domain-containing protein n=1 Tax=Anisakis simplex TaxID=6269 RepID=A0A0M3J2D4_ANISI|nr:unnamed protein product [Anisakis simplex]
MMKSKEKRFLKETFLAGVRRSLKKSSFNKPINELLMAKPACVDLKEANEDVKAGVVRGQVKDSNSDEIVERRMKNETSENAVESRDSSINDENMEPEGDFQPQSSAKREGQARPDNSGGHRAESGTRKRIRSRTSFVWKMVEETEEGFSCSLCGKNIKSACATNITAHMVRKHHKQLLYERQLDDKIRADAKASNPRRTMSVTPRVRTGQYRSPALTEIKLDFTKIQPSSTLNYDQKPLVNQSEPTKLLKMAIITSDMPITVIDNDLFKRYSSLIPHFTPITSNAMFSLIGSEFVSMFLRIKQILCKVDAVSISLTISMPTDPFSRAFVFIVVNFFHPDTFQFTRYLLDIVELMKNYTSDSVKESVEQVLCTYGIKHKVFRIVGDIGRTIQASLVEPFIYSLQGNGKPLTSEEFDKLSTEEAVQLVIEEKCDALKQSSIDGGNLPEVSDLEQAALIKCCESFEDYTLLPISTLMAVLHECFETNVLMQKLRECVYDLLKMFSKSAILMKALIMETGGKKLLLPADTDWITVYITYSFLLVVQCVGI